MVRRHLLAALAAGVERSDDDAARAALDSIDWILRGIARRRLERVLIDAALATGVHDTADAAATRHVLQAAALLLAKQEVELLDAARVDAAYRALRVARPWRLPIATIVAAAIALVSVTTVCAAAVIVVAGDGRPGAYQRPPAPPAVGAFRDGGEPARDAAIEHVLASELPRVVVMAYAITGHDVADDADRTARLAVLRDAPAFAVHGAGLQRAWREMVDSLDRWMVLSSGDAPYRAASQDLRAHVGAVTDQLAGLGLGYYIDPEIVDEASRRRAGIFTYRVEHVGFVLAERDRVRVLDLRRLDHQDTGAALLGMKAEELGDPVVLLDAVEDKVTDQILPVLGGYPYPLGDDGWARARGRTIAYAAGAAIRRELVTALGNDIDDPARATERCRQLVIASVRHHEAQHALDQARRLPYPQALANYLGEKQNEPFAIRARYELSGYLSQIASDMWLPQLTLWNLARHGFRRDKRTEEAFVAVVVLEGLARELGIRSPGPIIHHGEIDRDRLAALVVPIADRSTAELRSAAAAVWRDLFDERLVRIVDP